MSLVSEDERNNAVYSPSIKEKTNSSNRQQSLPTLPFDLIPEILSRLPVKLLLQLRLVCKSWNSLISDHKFAKKHLSLSTTTYSLHCLNYYNHKYMVVKSYSRDSVLTNFTTTHIPQLQVPLKNHNVYFIGSCNGILCLADEFADSILIQSWNPSIRKFKELPPLVEPQNFSHNERMYGFGYDPVSDNYKVVLVLPVFDNSNNGNANVVHKSKVKVHTLGTDSWKNIPVFPFVGVPIQLSGQYVSGTINWLACVDIRQRSQCFIASLDLRDESYQEVLLPDYGAVDLRLSACRDCLCMIAGEDIWIMKEYENKKFWTKLFTISDMQDPLTSSCPYFKAKYVFEDDQVLLKSRGSWPHRYIFYNFRNDTTSKVTVFEDTPEICIESLISPYF